MFRVRVLEEKDVKDVYQLLYEGRMEMMTPLFKSYVLYRPKVQVLEILLFFFLRSILITHFKSNSRKKY